MPEENESKAPRRALSADDKEQIRDVLTRPEVVGNIALAAKLLDVSYGQLESFVRNDPYLSALCPSKDASKLVPDETDIINRPPLPPDDLVTLTPQQFEEYQALIRQNRRLMQKDWEALGLSDTQAQKAEAYGKLGAAPLGQVIRMTHGQLIKNSMMLDEVIDRDGRMILEGKVPEETNAKGEARDPEVVEREWRHTLFAGMKLQLDIHTHLTKSQAMMAEALKKMQQAMVNSGKPRQGRLAGAATQPPSKTDIDRAPCPE